MTGEARRTELAGRLAEVEERVMAACRSAGRARSEVTLVAVTKGHPADDVAELARLGVRNVAESRDQEAREKVAGLAELGAAPVRWHFVGQLQRNKARSVASYATWVHTVDRPELVEALAVAPVRPQGILLQVDLDPAPSPGRGGADPRTVPELADRAVAAGLVLAGVMAVAPRGADPREAFDRLAEVSAEVLRSHPAATAISAGMSGDLESAVCAGATHLRVGSAILGNRPPLR